MRQCLTPTLLYKTPHMKWDNFVYTMVATSIQAALWSSNCFGHFQTEMTLMGYGPHFQNDHGVSFFHSCH